MSAPSLIELVEEYVERKNFTLPVFGKVAIKLQEIVSKDDFEIAEIERTIQSDPSLAGEILKAANSPYFKGLAEIKTVHSAVVRLGAEQVVNLAVMLSQRSNYSAKNPDIQGLMNKCWQGAVACAMTSRWICDKLSLEDCSEAFMAGLLHDVGHLFILTVLDKLLQSGSLSRDFSQNLIMELLRTVHAQKGHKLLSQWNLPEIYCTVARDHHEEEFDTSNLHLCMVRLADRACVKLGLCIEHDPSIELSETTEAKELGLTPLMLAEMEIMMEDCFQGLSVN